MNPNLETLIRLQELDLEIARRQQKLAEIAPRIDDMRVHYQSAERELKEGQAAVEAAKKNRRQAERDLDAQIEKLRKFEEQQSKVKTNKEYQALMGELESLRREKGTIEDRILALMEGQAEAEGKISGLAAEVAREKESFQQQEKVLLAEAARLKAELAEVEGQRAEAAGALGTDLVGSYQRIQKLRGTAVAEARDELCLGCRQMIPPQRFVEIMRNDSIQNCPHCHRILWYRRPEPVPAAPEAPAAEAATQ